MAAAPPDRLRGAARRLRRLAAAARARSRWRSRGGLVAGGRHEPAERRLAARFAAAWERGDYAAMHAMLTPPARAQRGPPQRFARAYRGRGDDRHRDEHPRLARPRPTGATAPSRCRSRSARGSSARSRGRSRCRSARTRTASRRSPGSPHLVFPGLRPRRGARPRHADAAARDDRGPRRHGASPRAKRGCPTSTRSSPRSPAGSARRRPSGPRSWPRRGVPDGAPVGLTGLEREFDARARRHSRRRAAGRPARAGQRGAARRGSDVRTTIDPDIQRAAVEALAGRYGGIAAVRPRTGEVLALAGVGVLGPAAARLDVQDHHARGALEARRRQARTSASRCRRRRRSRASSSRTPTASRAAARSSSRSRTPATRCSPRSAPSSAPRRLVATAERFGFNEEPVPHGRGALDDPGRGRDRRRPRGRLDGDRPGQGAHHAAADGARGGDDRRGRPAPAADAAQGRRRPDATQALRPSVARFVGRSMRAVVTERHRASARRSRASPSPARPAPPSCARRSARTRCPTRREAPAARGHDRHRRLVRRLRPGTAPADRGRGAVHRPGRRRRDRRAGRRAGDRGGS